MMGVLLILRSPISADKKVLRGEICFNCNGIHFVSSIGENDLERFTGVIIEKLVSFGAWTTSKR